MTKIQKLEESLLTSERVISSLEKSRDADKVGGVGSSVSTRFPCQCGRPSSLSCVALGPTGLTAASAALFGSACSPCEGAGQCRPPCRFEWQCNQAPGVGVMLAGWL